jgi:hypothetical protein
MDKTEKLFAEYMTAHRALNESLRELLEELRELYEARNE